MYDGFQGLFLNMLPNFKNNGLDLIGYNIVCLIIPFYPIPMLVNINRLKPYMFIKNKTL
jgi:hypothetical protein